MFFESLELRSLLAADFVPGELLVQFAPGDEDALNGMNQNQGAEVIQTLGWRGKDHALVQHIKLPKGQDVMAMAQRYMAQPGVLSAEPNWIIKKSDVSNDTSYTNGSLWGMYSDDSPTPYGGGGTTNTFGSGAEEAWGAGYTGSNQVVVGVVDEGIDISHPDLQQNIWVNPREIPNDGVDNDGDGYVDDVNGWDFYNNDNTVYDGGTGDTHGTHVSGTIGGVGGNGIGVAGVNWNVKIISAKFLGPNGGTTAGAIQAIDYLTKLKVTQGVNVVALNNSWGGGGYSSSLHASIIRAANAGILFVAAAGNSALNNDATANYPSNYSTLVAATGQPAASYESVIAVAALTSTGGLASFSNYGATQVDIAAPGANIVSTLPGNTYGSYSGTSMATPHVTGAVALYAAAKPTATPAQIRTAILSSAVATPSLAGKVATGGRLSVLDAINYVPPTNLSISNANLSEGAVGQTSTMNFNVSLSAPATQAFTVNYATANGSATSPSDFTATSGTLSFAVGESSKTIPVSIIGDSLVEPNETFAVNLSNISTTAVRFGTSSGTGTIVNDDSTQLSINDVSLSESTASFVFTVSLTNPSSSTITVRVATANGTAVSGKNGDYIAATATLTFNPNETTKTFSVTINNDTVAEPTESFFVNLSSSVNATIARSQGIGTILDDDGFKLQSMGSPLNGSPLSGSDWNDLMDDLSKRRLGKK